MPRRMEIPLQSLGRAPRVRRWALILVILILWLAPQEAAGLPQASDSTASTSGDAAGGREIPPPILSFPEELLRNAAGLFNRDNFVPFLVGSALAVGTIPADDPVHDYFGKTRRLKELGDFGDILGKPAVSGGVSVGLLFVGRLTDSPQIASLGFDLSQGFVLGTSVTAGLKSAAGRIRPNGEPRSFPSGHTRDAFTIATIVSDYYPRSRIPAYAIAALIGASRLEKDKHYLTDAIAGATLGYIVGETILRRRRSNDDSALRWTPTISVRDGVVAGVIFEW